MKHAAYERIKEDLEQFADWNVQATVMRKDLEQLLKDYERLVTIVEQSEE